MPPGGQEPLIQRPGSQSSNERGIEEEDALLTGQATGKQTSKGAQRSKWREIGLFVWAVIASAALIVLAVLYQHSTKETPTATPNGKRNLIFMVSDGMGPTSLTMTREWRQYVEGLPIDDTLVLDQHLIGQSRTRSSSSLITDSAAGATAFSCGKKSYNGAISVLPNHEPCGSVMEAAKMAGYTTGLVVTTRVTDATPAVFVSHVRRREMEDEIALQMIGENHPLGRNVDLVFGGGRCHFLPNTTDESCRDDGTDAVRLAKKSGWKYAESREEFDKLGTSIPMPFLGLFAEEDFPYEIDRRENEGLYPSLAEMSTKALKALSASTKDSDQGFFIMIEGSRIDHAGHANDPAAQVQEVKAYDEAMAAVLDFIKHEDTPTVMVSTSDHETGGLAAARQLHASYPQYLWYPGVLANVSRSASNTSHEYHAHLGEASTSSEDLKAYLTTLASSSLGIYDCTQDELDSLVDKPELSPYVFADMISRRAQTGWSTHGHSGADVNIYSSDPEAARALVGNHENTEVGDFLRSYLGLDHEMEEVTKKLREHMRSTDTGDDDVWLGRVPQEDERLDGQDHLDHYIGDHKHKKRCHLCGA